MTSTLDAFLKNMLSLVRCWDLQEKILLSLCRPSAQVVIGFRVSAACVTAMDFQAVENGRVYVFRCHIYTVAAK